MTDARRHWIAWAPIGVNDWESPALIFDYDEGAVERYRALGWTVEGPFEPAGRAIQVIDEMINEVLTKKRSFSKPLTGGARQAPFDGELLGLFIRYGVLEEARALLLDHELDHKTSIDRFRAEAAVNE
jgi:hypothetical protein